MEVEKINFKNSKGLNLVGAMHFPKEKTNSIVIIAHGFTSSKDRPRFVKLAEALSHNGFVAFRFDFGGHGESEDRIISFKDQIDDYNSAIDFVISKGYNKIGLFGSSFGGLCSILVYSSKIRAMVLWAPNTKSSVSELYNEQAKKEIEKQGFVYFNKGGKRFRIGEEYFLERQNINQEELLSNVKVSVLIIHGNEDDLVPLQDSKDALNYLPKGSKLEIIEGAGHNLDEHVDEVIDLSVNWFKEHLVK